MILILSNSMKHSAIIASPNSIMFWNVNLLSNYYIENNRPWKRWTTSHAAIGSNIRLFFEAASGLKWTNPNGLKCSSSYKKDIARIMIKLLDHLQVIYKSNHIIIVIYFFLCHVRYYSYHSWDVHFVHRSFIISRIMAGGDKCSTQYDQSHACTVASSSFFAMSPILFRVS